MYRRHNDEHCSPAIHILGMIAWLLTALGAIHLGLIALGFDFWKMQFLANLPAWSPLAVGYAMGAAGVISLILWFMNLGNAHCDTKHTTR